MSVFSPCRFEDTIVIIDPGHGGEDGGAISLSGKQESEINLAISLRLDQLLHFYGVNTVMTRSEDVSIHDSTATTIREKKISDLHNRVTMINAMENATLISIHQNSFAKEDSSMLLAQNIQDNAQLILDPDNQRKPLKIPSTVYLMNHISCRAVLVECGFLSNPMDDQLLQKNTYQTKVAITIAAAGLSLSNS
jgi:N-acetylmuramoyl-L-alanine amidase